MYIRKLLRFDGRRLRDHYLRLDVDDRRLRFFGAVSNEFIEAYARRVLMAPRRAVGYFAGDELRAVGELVFQGYPLRPRAEIALSVEREHRRKGVGRRLMDDLITIARNRGARDIRVMCLPDNYQMRHLIAAFEGHGVTAGGVFDAKIAAAWPNPWSTWKEAANDVQGVYGAWLRTLVA